MRINFTARHFKAPERFKEIALRRAEKLNKYFDPIIECEIILDYEKLTQVAEISVKVAAQTLCAIERSEDMYKSIDSAFDKVERQLKKHKAKLRGYDHVKTPQISDSEV